MVYFLRLGTFGFGGSIVLAGYMQRDLVETRRWVSRADYLEGLAFSQLSQGPLAAQLAMYIGWLRARSFGATLVGIAFVLPSFRAERDQAGAHNCSQRCIALDDIRCPRDQYGMDAIPDT